MVRRIASQVHKTVSRLKEAQLIPEPSWFQSVLAHPPLPVPPRGTPKRSRFDSRERVAKTDRPTSSPIEYLEDKVRRRFFRDHPFEALRARSLVEQGQVAPVHRIEGKGWTRLSEHGPNPVAEEAVRFAVNIHVHQDLSLARAYQIAVNQFRSLRSEFVIANAFAAREQEYTNGHVWGLREAEQSHGKEEHALSSWTRSGLAESTGQQMARKRWKAVGEEVGEAESWTRGREYMRNKLVS